MQNIGQKYRDVSETSLNKEAVFTLKVTNDPEDGILGVGLVNSKNEVYGKLSHKGEENIESMDAIDDDTFASMTGNTHEDFILI